MGVAFHGLPTEPLVAALCMYPESEVSIDWTAKCPVKILSPRSRLMALAAAKFAKEKQTKKKQPGAAFAGEGGAMNRLRMAAAGIGVAAANEPPPAPASLEQQESAQSAAAASAAQPSAQGGKAWWGALSSQVKGGVS